MVLRPAAAVTNRNGSAATAAAAATATAASAREMETLAARVAIKGGAILPPEEKGKKKGRAETEEEKGRGQQQQQQQQQHPKRPANGSVVAAGAGDQSQVPHDGPSSLSGLPPLEKNECVLRNIKFQQQKKEHN